MLSLCLSEFSVDIYTGFCNKAESVNPSLYSYSTVNFEKLQITISITFEQEHIYTTKTNL